MRSLCAVDRNGHAKLREKFSCQGRDSAAFGGFSLDKKISFEKR
jgi:hypothetical protein